MGLKMLHYSNNMTESGLIEVFSVVMPGDGLCLSSLLRTWGEISVCRCRYSEK